jgi:hypothetical protein
MFIIAIIDMAITFSITTYLGIVNTVILRTFTFTYGDITWEVIIFLLLFGIGGFICDKKFAKSKNKESLKTSQL